MPCAVIVRFPGVEPGVYVVEGPVAGLSIPCGDETGDQEKVWGWQFGGVVAVSVIGPPPTPVKDGLAVMIGWQTDIFFCPG